MHKKSLLNSPRLLEFQKKKRRVIRNKIILILVLILVVFIGLCFISRISKLNISHVVISGNKVIDSSDIQKVVDENLIGHYFWFLPKTNLVLLPKRKIKNNLEDKYKRLKGINISIKKDRTLEISVGERVGDFTWCGQTLPDVGTKPEENKCYFMDAGGYIFDQAPYFSGSVYFKYFGKIEGLKEDPAGFTFLPNNFPKINTFREAVEKMGVKPATLFVKENNVAEIYLSSNVLPPNSPKIIFNTDADLMKLGENLQASIGADPLVKDLREKPDKLEYIDLRFGNKVYYKFK